MENTGSEERSHSNSWRGEELGGGEEGGNDDSLSANTPLLVEASPSFGVGSRTGEESTSGEDMSSPPGAAVSRAGEEETGVGTDDVLGVGFLEAGKTTSIIMLDRVRRAAGPAASFVASLRDGPGPVAAGSLGACESWALDRVARAGCNRLRLGRGGMM